MKNLCFALLSITVSVAASTLSFVVLPSLVIAQEKPPVQASFAQASAVAQAKVVKIFGAGGAARLEGYQSGFLISGQGHLLTAWSYVLDVDEVTIVLADGQRFDAKLVSADPVVGIALLKFEYKENELPHFRLQNASKLSPGSRILAFSNLYRVATGDEAVSVQHGVVAAIAPPSVQNSGTRVTLAEGAYILDAIVNNPGASGGALTDSSGNLAGMLGKEIRDPERNTWLNHAIPVAAFAQTVDAMLAGNFVAQDAPSTGPAPEEPLSLSALGIVLVPDVIKKTPPFVDAVMPNTPAAQADMRPDDLIVYVGNRMIPSRKALQKLLSQMEIDTPIEISFVRQGKLIQKTLTAKRRNP